MWLGLAGLCAAVLSLAGIFLYLDPQIPKPETYRNVKLETPLRVYADDGALLAEFGERRLIPITFDEVPQHFIDALLDTEDKRFYQHSGIDFISLANDVLALVGTFVTEGELGAGASTITMQLARNVSFSLERRFLRKFKEMLLALKIERELSKEQILELYINVVPFGKRAYGAQAAALTYYGKRLNELSLPQLAMLAGIPQAPSAGNPINGPSRALARRNLVLSRMYAQGSIDQAAYESARAEPISAKIYARELDVPSPYAAEWVRRQAAALYPDLYTGGYEIHTTIRAGHQAEAIAALRRGLMNYDRLHGYRGAEDTANEEMVAALTLAAEQLSAEPEAYPLELTNAVRGYLNDKGTFGGLRAAMVLAVTEQEAIAQFDDGERVTLLLSDSGWAREYITVDRRGPPPQTMSDIVSIGEVIRVRKQQAQERGETAEEGGTDRWLLTQLPEIQGAVVSLDPHNGAVRALVGGFDFYRNQYNHALQAARQPGSGFKPFVYSAALAQGVTPADVFMDAPLVFDDENLESQYRPDNDNNRYNGPTRLREALYRSINLVSMRVLLAVGAGRVMDHVAKFGFDTSNFPRNTQLAIGGGTMAVTPIDMARAYAVLANGGYLVEPHIITRITDITGTTLYQANYPQICDNCEALIEPVPTLPETFEPASLEALLAAAAAETEKQQAKAQQESSMEQPTDTLAATATDDLAAADSGEAAPAPPPEPVFAEQVVDERNTFVMHSMLQDVIKRGTGRSARRLRRDDIAGKTGTTNDAADTWFNGYTPELVTTVWVGFSNHAPLGARAYGSNTPLPIWIDLMEDVLASTEEVYPSQPPGVVTLKIDPSTGELARPGQNNAIFEYFLAEFAPEQQQTTEPPRDTPDETLKAIDIFGG